jgi:hypothetical protein
MVHLDGFTIEIYQDARSHKGQILLVTLPSLKKIEKSVFLPVPYESLR